MQDKVGIVRTESEMLEAIDEIQKLKEKANRSVLPAIASTTQVGTRHSISRTY